MNNYKRVRNPLGRFGPWSWAVEPVRGCNLRCGHRAVRLFEEDWRFMDRRPYEASDLWSAIALRRRRRAFEPIGRRAMR